MDDSEMKKMLRATREYKPQNELLLGIAINESVQFVWDAHEWSFKTIVDTFTATGATYELPANVDNILELTYGDNNRHVTPLPTHRIAEVYSDQTRTGSITYNYSLYSADADALTLLLIPAPSSGTVFTYRAYRKIDYGELSAIPEKLHSLVFTGARTFLAKGIIEHWPALENAIQRDKPIRHKRWTMGVDGLHANRVSGYNTMRDGGNQDVTRPID